MIPVKQISAKRFFPRDKSSEIARQRIKLLLVSDRADYSPELLEMIRNDFLRSISRYMKIDASELTFRVIRVPSEIRGAKVPALYASIPILDLRK